MNIFTTILHFLATIGYATALALFLYWVTETFGRNYRAGESMAGSYSKSGDIFHGPASFLAQPVTALLPLADNWSHSKTFGIDETVKHWENNLVRAGWRGRISGQQFFALMILLSGFLFLTTLLALVLLGTGFVTTLLIATGLGAVPVLLMPMLLQSEVRNRVSMIEKRLPFAAEFMLLALEARAAFQGAIEVYCAQMPADPLGDELRITLSEMREGLTIQDALLALSKRIESADVSAFVLALTTGISTGQPLHQVMEVQANQARQRRFQAAEQIAKTAATRATLPLFIAVVSIVILLIGPLIIRIARQSLF